LDSSSPDRHTLVSKLRENLAAIFIIPSSWGSQLDGEKLSTPYRIKLFSGAVAGEEEEDFCKGSFRTHILYFVLSFAFTLFLLALFYQKPQKISILYSCYFFTLVHYVVPQIRFGGPLRR
jgi:hypothetical protein